MSNKNEPRSTPSVKKEENVRAVGVEEPLQEIAPRELAQNPFIRAMIGRLIRLEREMKPMLLKHYQNPEATKVAFDNPVPETIIDSWIAEAFRQADIDHQHTKLTEKQAQMAKAEREAAAERLRQDIEKLPEYQQEKVRQAMERKAARAGA